jgi:hypothetical protein
MLSIREEQMAVFSKVAAQKFEDRMVAHLKRCFPSELESLGEPKARELIQHGVKRAASYGIRGQRDVCKYIDLMIALGSDFDSDPNLIWASEILNDPELRDPTTKVTQLQGAAIEYLNSGATTDGERKA